MQTHPPEAMQALVERSPAAVAAHDRPGWLALFARHACIEDPVGSRPVTTAKTGSIERFYDTFIAPNSIRFAVSHDYLGATSMVRDLVIHIQMAPAVTVSVPMHLRYEVGEESGALRINRLAAHWELLPMVGQLLKNGLPAIKVMLSLSARMLRQLGIDGTAGFSRAALTPRQRHYRLLEELLTAINCQDQTAVHRCFVTEDIAITDGNGLPLQLGGLKGMRSTKRIAAGNWISSSITLAGSPGVLMGEICPTRQKLLRCQLYR